MDNLEKRMRKWVKEQGIKIGSKVSYYCDDSTRERELYVITKIIYDNSEEALRLIGENTYLIDNVYMKDDIGGFYFQYDSKLANNKNKQLSNTNEYTFQEVVARIKEGETYECTNPLWILHSITRENNLLEMRNAGGHWNDAAVSLTAKFKKQVKSVTFQEALDSGKRVRVEYVDKLIKLALGVEDKYVIDIVSDMNINKFRNMSSILIAIGYKGDEMMRDIMNNGKWYIEE